MELPYHADQVAWRWDLVASPTALVEGGEFVVPDRPGLGVELNESAVQQLFEGLGLTPTVLKEENLIQYSAVKCCIPSKPPVELLEYNLREFGMRVRDITLIFWLFVHIKYCFESSNYDPPLYLILGLSLYRMVFFPEGRKAPLQKGEKVIINKEQAL